MPTTLSSVRERIEACKGRLVRCRMSKGRNRVEETEGILTDVYPKIFTLQDRERGNTVSFSYADVLTHEVQLEVLD